MEKTNADSISDVCVCTGKCMSESAHAEGIYTVKHIRDGVILSKETFTNTVMTEGKNAMLTNTLKGSSYTAVNYMGLISSVSFTSINALDTMANLVAGATYNQWKEAGVANAPTYTSGLRLAPSFGTASGGSMPQTATTNFTMTGAGTVKGCFLAIKSAAGVAPTSTVADLNGAMWSAGTFTDKVVAANDVIQVTYSTSL